MRPMGNFVKIADGLDVAPALAEIAGRPDYWIQLGGDALLTIPLLNGSRERHLEEDLPEVWRLIDRVLFILAAEHGDHGGLSHARIGLMPPGAGLPPHFDGIDGVRDRRYQLALASEPGVTLTVGGEAKWPRPGEAWRIEASRTHSVRNDSQADRITILFDTQR
jgi:aspartyl/asparaginyl beta-hydroxylase (cupin superfamily)